MLPETFFFDVAISRSPLRKTFTYKHPAPLKEGSRVLVSFSGRTTLGYVMGESAQIPKEVRFKEVEDVLDFSPLLEPVHLALASKVCSYFFAPPGKVMDLFFAGSPRVQVRHRVVRLDLKGECAPFSDKEGSISLELFFQRMGQKAGKKTLEEYIEKGRVEVVRGIEKKHPSGPTRVFYRLKKSLDGLMDPGITPQGWRILQYLLVFGEAPETELKKKLSLSSRSPLQTLEKKGLVEKVQREEQAQGYHMQRDRVELNPLQQAIVEQMQKQIWTSGKKRVLTHLLHGITGSGKTEIYFALADRVLEAGKRVLYLLPEISLTPQMIARVQNRFPENSVGVFHSALKPSQRRKQWLQAVNGETDILLGTRSSLWVPLPDPGIILLDEQHDESYMQSESQPVYDALHVASWMAALRQIPLVMGSATPRLESYWQAKEGKDVQFHQILERPFGVKLPEVKVVDMLHTPRFNAIFSREMVQRMDQSLSRDRQVFVLVGKKGYASYVMCQQCGTVIGCDHCDVSLTLHRYSNRLKCHYCGLEKPVPAICPSCGNDRLVTRGFGTEKVEEQLRGVFPEKKIIRIDRDNIQNLEQLHQALALIENRRVDVVVGTRMISKGLDFPQVELVVILDADQTLYFPDFRSSERTFQLVHQMAGRAGRADATSKVVIQTHSFGNRAISHSAHHDFDGFFHEEILLRKIGNYPPYCHLVQVQVYAYETELVARKANELAQALQKGIPDEVELLGPAPGFIFKLAGQYRENILLKCADPAQVTPVLAEIFAKDPKLETYARVIVDPLRMIL